jgi:hypothetical protein
MQVECEGVVTACREKEFNNCSVPSMVPIALRLCHQSSGGHPALFYVSLVQNITRKVYFFRPSKYNWRILNFWIHIVTLLFTFAYMDN